MKRSAERASSRRTSACEGNLIDGVIFAAGDAALFGSFAFVLRMIAAGVVGIIGALLLLALWSFVTVPAELAWRVGAPTNSSADPRLYNHAVERRDLQPDPGLEWVRFATWGRLRLPGQTEGDSSRRTRRTRDGFGSHTRDGPLSTRNTSP